MYKNSGIFLTKFQFLEVEYYFQVEYVLRDIKATIAQGPKCRRGPEVIFYVYLPKSHRQEVRNETKREYKIWEIGIAQIRNFTRN